VAGLIIDVQHRVTKTGKNFGSFAIEDFSGKTEFVLWSEDYIKFQNYLEKGQNVLLNGYFRPRYNRPNEFDFKVSSINLLESVKQHLTRSLDIKIHAASLTPEFVAFIETNVKKYPGKSSLRFNVLEPKENLLVSLYSFDKGFEMNEEMAGFLLDNPDVEVQVGLVG
jgi:DNA polymerase-3 subunit alpha